ncbi:MAG: hypothetical protein ACK5XN_34735, partial [Bacteroidota bacterium]
TLIAFFWVLAVATSSADAAQSAGPIPGQTFFSLHAARNMAAHNRLPKVQAEARFIALQSSRLQQGIPLPARRQVETKPYQLKLPEETAALKSVSMTQSQAKQILSIFAPSD